MKLYRCKRSDKTNCGYGCCGNKLAFRYKTHKNSRRAAKKRQRQANSKLCADINGT